MGRAWRVWERREFYVGFGEKRPLGRLRNRWELAQNKMRVCGLD